MGSGIVVFSRPGCHLCDDARRALDSAGIGYDEVDISRDPALQAEYGYVIPVVEVRGQSVFEAGMDPRRLPGLVRGAQNAAARRRGAAQEATTQGATGRKGARN